MKNPLFGIAIIVVHSLVSILVAPPPDAALAMDVFPVQDKVLKKELPKKTVLSKDSQSDKYGEVAFDHETHSTKPYSPDGKSLITCVDCHHSDQPAAGMKPPLKTSERAVVLTLDVLKVPESPGVKNCRACHLQVGDDSAESPKVTYEGKTTPTKLTNEIAYHQNCNLCHDAAIKARPTLKGKIAGSEDCVPCHVKL